MAECTSLHRLSSQQYVFNELVLLTHEIVKCCCCNVLIATDNTSIIDHLESETHKNHMNMLSEVELNLSHDQCEKIFHNHIVIVLKSASSLVEKKKFFTSLCYKCEKVITDGVNGVNQHIQKKQHLKPSTSTEQYFCSICNINVINKKFHLQNLFHKQIMENNSFYNLSNKINKVSEINISLKKLPLKPNSIQQYINIMINLIKEEEKCQRAYTNSCSMLDVTVFWEGDVGPDTQPLAKFVPNYSDDEYFRLKLGDELVITSSDLRQWNMSGRIIQIPSFDDDNITMKLTNGTGVKKNIHYPYKINPKWRETVYWRMRNAIVQLRLMDRNEYNFLFKALLNEENIDENNDIKPSPFNPLNIKATSRNSSTPNVLQLKCIRMALKEPFCLIQGPPGTGKTETCVNIIFNLVQQQSKIKILVCAQSNAAVDLLATKLDAIDLKLIRYFSSRYEFLDSPLKRLGLLEKTFQQDEALRDKYSEYCQKKLSEEEMMKYGTNFYEARMRAWDMANVICCTCITAGAEDFKDNVFDVVLVDEAAQAVEPEVLVPILMHSAKKIILVGDHKQLGPVVMSEEAKKAGFTVSLFERLISQNNVPKIMLDTQYRMHPTLAQFASEKFYDGLLKNGVKATDRSLPLKWLDPDDKAIVMVNASGTEMSVGTSFSNEREVQILITVLKLLINNNIQSTEIGVISPYDGQRRLIQQLFKAERNLKLREVLSTIQVANVDAFQGQENEVIILSCVRSNYSMTEAIGFLKEPTRINVALTRAKCKLIIIGNANTLRKSKMYAGLIDFITSKGTVIEDDILCEILKNLTL